MFEEKASYKPIHYIFLLLILLVYLINVQHYSFLGDDAFISFRYAKHFARGDGLVWNLGEAVEGYTNFLWVLILAFGMKLNLSPESLSITLSTIAGFLTLVYLFKFSLRIGSRHSFTFWIPVLYLAINRSFAAWSTSGLETMLFTALIFIGFFYFFRERENNSKPYSVILFVLASLTRPEGILFSGGVIFLKLFDALRAGSIRRSDKNWIMIYFSCIALHFSWRYLYYGYWLPNTFYAKVGGIWIDQGIRYLLLFLDNYQLLWFLPFIFLAPFLSRKYEVLVSMLIVCAYLLYVVCVGGDRFEYRFIIVCFPFLLFLIASALHEISKWGGAFRYAALGLFLFLLLFDYSGSRFEPKKNDRHGIAMISGIKGYADRRIQQGKYLSQKINEGKLPRDLVVGLGGVGAIPYYTDWTTVDRRGLNDLYISHLPLKQRGIVAHEREAPYDYLTERKVVVFDIFNRLLHTPGAGYLKDAESTFRPGKFMHDGKAVRIRAIDLGEKTLLFATFVPDADLLTIFKDNEVRMQ
ncbi:MAG: hypothetical protein H6619_03660 [Deltaproteobacteria bacterium]|nr:hypothetical protein [Deltaproteobacteria bacterium]